MTGLGHILKWVQGVMPGKAAGQGGDLMSQNTDLHLLPLIVWVRLCRGGTLVGDKEAGECLKLTVRHVLHLDRAALLWLLQKTEVILVQNTVNWDLIHVGHRQAVWNYSSISCASLEITGRR